MGEYIVVCPTLKRARQEWENMCQMYPDMWLDVRKNPFSLIDVAGHKIIFMSENEPDKLRGTRASIVSVDDIFADEFGVEI